MWWSWLPPTDALASAACPSSLHSHQQHGFAWSFVSIYQLLVALQSFLDVAGCRRSRPSRQSFRLRSCNPSPGLCLWVAKQDFLYSRLECSKRILCFAPAFVAAKLRSSMFLRSTHRLQRTPCESAGKSHGNSLPRSKGGLSLDPCFLFLNHKEPKWALNSFSCYDLSGLG